MTAILLQPIQSTLQRWQQYLMPGTCLLCADDSGSALLCPACSADLPTLPEIRCPQCGEQTTHGERCGACLKDPPAFTRTHALFRYEFPLDRLIQALKYGHQLALAAWAGDQLAPIIEAADYDSLIPLPLHPLRLRERGFNQSIEIARRLARHTGLPLDHQSLIRRRATAPQAELAIKERARNVRGAFECQRDLSGRRLLLIDDVMTTGATLREAARVLALHGATRIDLAVIARALKH